MLYKNRFNFITLIRKITCYDVSRQNQVFNIITSELNHQVLVTNLNSTQSCAIDNRCHRKHFVFSIAQKRELFHISKNPAEIFSLRMVSKNLAASHRSVALKWNEASVIRVYGVVANRELNLVNAVNAHRNRLTLAAKVPCQLFLSLNNVLKHRIINCLTGNHKSNHVRTDIFKLRVNLNNAVAVIVVAVVSHQLHIINSLSTFVKFNLAGNTVCRPKIRTVCII